MDNHSEMREKRVEDLERRLDDLEHRRSALERSRAAAKVVVPDETWQHLRAAGREQLLAVRSLLDHWINRMKDDRPEESSAAREDIRVD